MSSAEKAAQLRALAEQFEGLGTLEEDLESTLASYREDPSEENKAAYEAAKEALRAGRQEIREADVMAVANEPGSSTIGVAPIQAGKPRPVEPDVSGVKEEGDL